MKSNQILLIAALLLSSAIAPAQDDTEYKLRLEIPVIDLPQNTSLPYRYPSMNQALEFSAGMYDLAFWGIDELGDAIFNSRSKPSTRLGRFSNNAFKYVLGLGFSKYGSELPVPLGVWAHEEYHRSVLGISNISSKNGNWFPSRWDGTVYGISDMTLEDLKASNIDNLLYSYVAGVQYEINLNERITVSEFYFERSLPKASLLLFNAWYVYDYFRFSSSPASDSVKVLAPPHENSNPSERDYAGADLNAWIHDMFNPDLPYTSRDPFPGGEGVNRRIGFSDLSSEEQDYLNSQKKLSLLNFINPGIFFIDRIKVSDGLSFNFFTQYSPTHFGNDIALFVPVNFRRFGLMVNAHRYSNRSESGLGAGLGLYNLGSTGKVRSEVRVNVWSQPESFFSEVRVNGGYIGIKTRYLFSNSFSGFVSVSGKTRGWLLGNPYLDKNASVQAGLAYELLK